MKSPGLEPCTSCTPDCASATTLHQPMLMMRFIMDIKIITIVIIIISRLHWLDHFIYTVKPWVPCSWTKKLSYAQFWNKEDKEKAELQVTYRRCWGKCRGFKRQNFQPAQMYTLSSHETNAPHLCFFHKESTDVAPLKFKSAMCLRKLFLYKATFTVYIICTL
jgi:hypothetical protein